jgi:phosphoribosylformylglycinamidine (FGAM) synthase PurS component
MTVSVWVRRKTRDLVRDAAEDLLRATGERVERIERAELWRFEVERSDEPETTVRRILDETTLVVNPNVHRYSLEERGGPPAARTRLRVEVRDRVDAKGAAVLRSIRERLGVGSVTGVTRSVLWSIDLDADEERARSVGRRLSGDGERGAGVLANRHAQITEIHLETE